jgi:hypothetical protein
LTGTQSLISKNRDGSMGHDYTCELLLNKSPDNTLCFEVGSSTAWAWSGISTELTVSANTWYHIAGVVSGSNMYLYVNGVVAATGSVVAPQWPDDMNPDMALGTHVGPGDLDWYFSGYLTDVRIWGVGRTQVQIQNAMTSSLAGNEVGLQAYFPMSEGTGTSVGDYHINVTLNDATLNAATWTLLTSLPIQLVSFAGSQEANDVVLKWKTLSEINNYGFDIQKKAGASSDWTKVGFVAGHGTTVDPHAYQFSDGVSAAGTYSYRLKQLDTDGKLAYSDPVVITVAEGLTGIAAAPVIPTAVTLMQNYPNPFNPSTTIRFGVPAGCRVTLTVYSALGQRVATLVDGEVPAGYHDVKFDAQLLCTGTYFYRLVTASLAETKSFMLVR